MRGPSHNATLPFPLAYKGSNHSSLRQLFASLNPPTHVHKLTITGRLRKRLGKGEPATEALFDECIYLNAADYQQKYGKRITWIKTDLGPTRVDRLYAGEGAKIPYKIFRTRLKSLDSRGMKITDAQISDAASLLQVDWTTKYGGGRRKTFIYDGDFYAEYRGEYSAFTAFLKKIDRYDDRDLLHSRLKARWAIDDMLLEPPMVDGAPGYIYQLTDVTTGKLYVGLTVNKPHIRFGQHRIIANKGGGSLLHTALRTTGADNFNIDVLEIVSEGGDKKLSERERYWIKRLETIHPNGLNRLAGGQIGSYAGKAVVWDERTFRSISAMCRLISAETGLAAHVIERRYRSALALTTKARKHSKHPDAGTDTFRQYLGVLKRATVAGVGVVQEWQDYDRFKDDVGKLLGKGSLTRIDESRPWGPYNITRMAHTAIVERTHGKAVTAFCRTWATLANALQEFGMKRSTYNLRIKAGWSIEDALSKPLGATSKRVFVFEGESWPSRNQACKVLAARYDVTEHKVKDRFVRRIPTSRWREVAPDTTHQNRPLAPLS